MHGIHKSQGMELYFCHPVGVPGRGRKIRPRLFTDFIIPEPFQNVTAPPVSAQRVCINRKRRRVELPCFLYRHKDKVGRRLIQETNACQQGIRFPYVHTHIGHYSRKPAGS